MTQTFKFAVLRFTYDALTEEFVNVGVVVYSPSNRYLNAQMTSSYARVSRLFVPIDGTRFRQTSRYIEDRIRTTGDALKGSLELEGQLAFDKVLSRILPSDDSSFRFTEARGGISENLDKTLETLFSRYVDTYNHGTQDERRSEDEVWRTFRDQFEKRAINAQLVPKKIVARNYEYNFEHAWKNGVWNLYEPVSFDLLDGSAMLEKANKWVGRAFALSGSLDAFKLTFLLGAPTNPKLFEAYRRAENLLNGIKVKHQFIREKDASEFALELSEIIRTSH